MNAIIYPNIHALYQAKCEAFDKLAAAATQLCENHEALLEDYDQVIEEYRDLSEGYDVITEALHESDIQIAALRTITGNDALTFFSQEEKIQDLEKQTKRYEETLQDIVDHLAYKLNFTASK